MLGKAPEHRNHRNVILKNLLDPPCSSVSFPKELVQNASHRSLDFIWKIFRGEKKEKSRITTATYTQTDRGHDRAPPCGSGQR